VRNVGGAIAAIGSAVLEGLCGVCGYCPAAPSESQRTWTALEPLPQMNREGLTPSGGSPPSSFRKKGKRIAAIAALAVKPVWEGISACGYCAAIVGKRGRIAASGHAVLESVYGVCGVCGYCPAAPSESQEPV